MADLKDIFKDFKFSNEDQEQVLEHLHKEFKGFYESNEEFIKNISKDISDYTKDSKILTKDLVSKIHKEMATNRVTDAFTKQIFKGQQYFKIIGKSLDKYDNSIKESIARFGIRSGNEIEKVLSNVLQEQEGFWNLTEEEQIRKVKNLSKEYSTIVDSSRKVTNMIDESAKNYTSFFEDKFDNVIDILKRNKIVKFLGIDTFAEDWKNKVMKKIDSSIKENIIKRLVESNTGLESLNTGTLDFKKSLSLISSPIGIIVASFAAVGVVLYSAYKTWKKIKETTIDYVKNLGTSFKVANDLTNKTKNLFYMATMVGVSWEDSKETISGLYKALGRSSDITNDLVKSSLLYQKRWGMTAEEAANIISTQKQILGYSDKQMQKQDSYIDMLERQYDTIGFSAKEFKKLLTDSKVVANFNPKKIEKAYIASKNMRLEWDKMMGLAGAFEIGDFEGSIEKATQLAQRGIHIDPFEVQVALDNDQPQKVIEMMQRAFKESGKDITQLSGLERKLIKDAIGGEENFLELQKVLNVEKDKQLSKEQKIQKLREASLEDMLKQTTSLQAMNRLGNLFSNIWDNLMSKLSPIFDAIYNGFEEAYKPLANLVEEKDGLFSKESVESFKEIGKSIGFVVGGIVNNFDTIVNTLRVTGTIIYDIFDSFIISPLRLGYNILAGFFNSLKSVVQGFGWLLGKIGILDSAFGYTVDEMGENAVQSLKDAGQNSLNILETAGKTALAYGTGGTASIAKSVGLGLTKQIAGAGLKQVARTGIVATGFELAKEKYKSNTVNEASALDTINKMDVERKSLQEKRIKEDYDNMIKIMGESQKELVQQILQKKFSVDANIVVQSVLNGDKIGEGLTKYSQINQ